ncbi:FAD-binding oxidoreductase [Pseudonocardia sp. CA-107938]|uniref:FAD-binding oxidoreductase n=1 Tax=Pseudonocardia sp. CA-107938 TaxID=3240021 RepID=UPI003D919D10
MTDLDGLRAALDGTLLTPDSPGYDAARLPALPQWRDVRPLAVVRCASARDVAGALRFAATTGTHVVPRGGGHCFAGRSSTDGLLLDLGPLDAVTVDADGRARIGAGARLAQVYDALHAHGRTIPAGCGPTVGIAGLALGGGIGLLGRRHGLTCDAVVEADVVLADGRCVRCSADTEPELFWALRGAGGGQFGVVTSLVLATVPEPVATRIELHWPAAAAADVITAWQAWAPDAPDDVTVNLAVVAEPGRPLRVTAFGAALRDPDATSPLLAELIDLAGAPPRVDLRGGLPVRDLKRSFAGDGPADPVTSRSEFFARPLPAAAITDLLDGLAHEHAELNFTAMGGAYNRVAVDATAFAHRGERFLLEHVGRRPDHVDRSWTVAHAHGSGRVYPNFPDQCLDGWAQAYHGENLARLRAAKQAYDPDRLFRFPQGLGSA